MADTPSSNPMTDADASPPADTDFQPAAPLKNAGVEFDAEGGTLDEGQRGGASTAIQGLKDNAAKLTSQAGDRARGLAEQGKERAGGALDELSRMLTDAAGTVDDKLGAQYGQYARSAATSVSGFAEQIRGKDLDELIEDARTLVRKSPAVAIGTAAAVGFVLARLISAGVDQRDA